MKGQTCFVVAFFTATFLVDVLGYGNGLVSQVCESMVPGHGSDAQSNPAPYTITANATTFNPGDVIQVTLDSNPGQPFGGFLLEARGAQSSTIPLGTFSSTTDAQVQLLDCNVGGTTYRVMTLDSNPGQPFGGFLLEARGAQSSTIPLGTFSSTTDAQVQLLDCNVGGTTYRNSAVSHTSAANKAQIIVNWIASNVGNITFRATFVQRMPTFWTGVTSSIIQGPASGFTVAPQISTASMSAADSNVDAISNDGCGNTKFCFSNPAGCNPATDQNCFLMSSTPLNNQGLRFEVSGMASGYIAIGFSDDQTMGNDDIYICGTDSNGRIRVQRAYSTGRSRPRNEPLGQVDNITVANNNGIIQCSFVTRNNISTGQRAANDLHYLFFAFGSSANGAINQHQRIPFISSEKVNVGVVQLVSGSSGRPVLIKAHGALMLIAWMTTASIGMMIAQYLKCIGGESKLLGKAWWFQLHFPLMMLTVVLTIIGFVLVFAQVKGWSYSAGAHPVLGCIVMGLTLIQPFVAIFRPSPDHKRRWIFKYFHTIMAHVIKALAVATLFLGLLLINVAPDKWPVKVLGGFVGWEFLVHIILILLSIFWRKGKEDCSTDKPMYPLLVVFGVYLCGNLAFLIAILVGIGQT